MSTVGRRFHEEFRPERIEREMRAVHPGLLTGEYPLAFVNQLLRWGFGREPVAFSPERWVVMVVRDEMPEYLRSGFGIHVGAVRTSASSVPVMLDSLDHLKGFYEDRILDARFCRGEFSRTA